MKTNKKTSELKSNLKDLAESDCKSIFLEIDFNEPQSLCYTSDIELKDFSVNVHSLFNMINQHILENISPLKDDSGNPIEVFYSITGDYMHAQSCMMGDSSLLSM